ncbi:MAG: class I tRNA ligase family protein, partial [Solobacterium sp.]|nr:class I tRNA ligase family protein [Solobacterium sp.]
MDLKDKQFKLTPKRLEALERLHITTAEELLSYYPFRYEVLSAPDFSLWKEKDKVTFEAEVVSAVRSWRHGKMTTSSFDVMAYDHVFKVTIFNRPWARNLSMNQTIKKVSEDFEQMKFNTAIAQMMTLTNEINQKGSVTAGEYKTLLLLLSPVSPHICEEIWQRQGFGAPVYTQSWPQYDANFLTRDEVEIAVQLNGKVKGKLMIPTTLTRETAQEELP